jgi:hypothetical protein
VLAPPGPERHAEDDVVAEPGAVLAGGLEQ